MRPIAWIIHLSLALAAAGSLCDAGAAELTRETVNAATFDPRANEPGRRSPAMLKAQILLDRAHVSPGVIDGVAGSNSARALAAFEEMHGLAPDGKLDDEVWAKLGAPDAMVLVDYDITREDVAGPFVDVPASLEAMAQLAHLSYASPLELLAEKFHMDQELLQLLNPGADFGRAGATITVARVRDSKPDAQVARVAAEKSREAVFAYGAGGQIVAYYPATIGSQRLPSPTGETRVRSVALEPKYYYSPELDFAGAPQRNLTIAPGPNNPVGSVWIDLEREGYGIHGTPEPAEIGKEFSHGCVRLTNWDARELAGLVASGTPVTFTQPDR